MQRDWVTEGFGAFRAGTFGSGGQNLYVSRAGVLQRIHQFDVDGDGYLDLLFCNSQDHWERPPAYVFDGRDGYARTELPAEGGMGGAIADLNCDGTDDLVVANHYDGMNSSGVNSTVYYGSPAGWSLRRHQVLPTPFALSVAAGDFDGDGRPDLAFACTTEQGAGRVRVFGQSELGFEPKRFTDTGIRAVQFCAADLDGDGWTDLVVANHKVWGDHRGYSEIWWNGPDGFDRRRTTRLPTMGPHGMRSVEPGNQHDRGPEELYTSPVRRLADGARVIDLSWDAEVPADTWVRGRVRTGADEAAVRSAAWSPWAGCGERLSVAGGPCVQYQLALGAMLGKTTPRVGRVTLRYDVPTGV